MPDDPACPCPDGDCSDLVVPAKKGDPVDLAPDGDDSPADCPDDCPDDDCPDDDCSDIPCPDDDCDCDK